MRSIIPSSVLELNELFNKNDRKLYVVGGAVRDFKLGHLPKDFDLATNALPTEIIDFIDGKYKCNLQGNDFGVVVIYPEDFPDGFEVATFRSDIYDGKLGVSRNPKVKFTTIEEDCQRRDLTINAMFYDIELDEIVDYVGGINDIEAGICRFVGDALLRITEDPLRIMRIIRFAARYNFSISEETKAIILENSHMLNIIKKDRIIKEIKSSFGDIGNFTLFMELMIELGIYNVIFPKYELSNCVIDSSFLEVHLAFLLHHVKIDKVIDSELVQKYKLDSSIVSKIRFLHDLFEFDINNVLPLYRSKVDKAISDEMLTNWISLFKPQPAHLEAFIGYVPSISSETLIANGFSGKDLGNELRRLESIEFIKTIKNNGI